MTVDDSESEEAASGPVDEYDAIRADADEPTNDDNATSPSSSTSQTTAAFTAAAAETFNRTEPPKPVPTSVANHDQNYLGHGLPPPHPMSQQPLPYSLAQQQHPHSYPHPHYLQQHRTHQAQLAQRWLPRNDPFVQYLTQQNSSSSGAAAASRHVSNLPTLPSTSTTTSTANGNSKSNSTSNSLEMIHNQYSPATKKAAVKEQAANTTATASQRQHRAGGASSTMSSAPRVVPNPGAARTSSTTRRNLDAHLRPTVHGIPAREEDPLAPTEYGIYQSALIRKRKWLQECSVIHPLAPRTIGSAHERLQKRATSTTSCNCKGTRCLQLLCECFAAFKFCGPKCGCRTRSCCNGNDMNDADLLDRRREAVRQAVAADPVNAFRYPEPEARCGNPACDCFQLGVLCDPAQCECSEGCHGIADNLKRHFVQPSIDSNLPETSSSTAAAAADYNPLAYSIPLQVGTAMAPGLRFSRADPRYDSQAPAAVAKPPSSEQKLYHNLMLTPSKKIRQIPQPGLGAPTQGTEVECAWQDENAKLSTFFRQLGNIAETQLKSGDLTYIPEGSQDAAVIYKTVLDDMESVKNVVDAAKLNIMTVLYEQKKTGKYHCQSDKKRVDDEEVDLERDDVTGQEEADLRCGEQMPPFADLVDKLPESSDASRQLLIRAVQDTAMMREMARIIRRKARELAMMRARKSES